MSQETSQGASQGTQPLAHPVELAEEVQPIAFLLGTWQGAGVGGYPTIEEEFRFGQEVTFRHDGRPFVEYVSRTWILDEDGEIVRPAATESGYWRPKPGGKLEVVLSHPTGIAEIYVGEVVGPKVELRSDVVARTETAKAYTAGHRLYGVVEGDLMWAYDMAAMGQKIQPHLSARLKRVA